MKKTLAVLGASALGAAAVVATPTAAQAAPVTDACTGVDDHVVTNGTLADNWYMDCVPQYGLGKVEFDLTADEPIPADFLPLQDPGVTSVATVGDAAETYFGAPASGPAGFLGLGGGSSSTYEQDGRMVFPITAVQKVAVNDLPAGCDAANVAYANAYRVDYGAAGVTFSQVHGSRQWNWTVEYSPASMFLGLNFAPSDPANPDPATTDGNFDITAAQCASNGTSTLLAQNDSAPEWQMVTGMMATQGFDGSLSPFPTQLFPGTGGYQAIGPFNAVITADTPTPTPAPAAGPPAKVLPTMGPVPTPLPWAGALLLIGGVVMTLFARRKRPTLG